MFPFFLILGGQDSIKTRDDLWTNMMTAVAGGVGLSQYQVLPYQRLACDARKGSALFPGWSKFSQKIWWQRWHEVLACRTTKCCRTRDWPVVQKKAALCIRDGANSFKICTIYVWWQWRHEVFPSRTIPSVAVSEIGRFCIRSGANNSKEQ